MKPMKCKRCGDELSSKCNLIAHLRRKKSCEPLLCDCSRDDYILELKAKVLNEKTYECPHCTVKFNSYQNRWRHAKTCKKKQAEQEINSCNNDTITELQRQIQELSKEVLKCKTVINNTHNGNIQNITNNQTVNINVRDFGHENTSYLPNDFLSRCFVNKDLVNLLENLHCDRDHRENHNVRIRSTKNEIMEVWQNDRWVVTCSDETLKDLIQSGYRILTWHSRKHKTHIIENELDGDRGEYEDIKEWFEEIYENDHKQKPLKKKLLLLFMTNRTLLLGKDI